MDTGKKKDINPFTDLAQAHIPVLHYLQRNGRSEVFNLGNGDGFPVREVIACERLDRIDRMNRILRMVLFDLG